MSDYDDMSDIFDEDELEAMYENNQDNMTPEDIFKMVMVNKVKGVTVKVELRDKDGDVVEMPDVIEQLLEYIKDKLTDGNNQFVDQVMPLMSSTMASALGRMIGIPATMFYVSQDQTRMAFIHSMAIGFLLLKFVQQKGITIHTYEEEITEDEIDDFERRSKANNVASLAAMAGQDSREVLRSMLKDGKITEEDLQSLLGEEEDNDDDEEDDN